MSLEKKTLSSSSIIIRHNQLNTVMSSKLETVTVDSNIIISGIIILEGYAFATDHRNYY